MFGFGVDIGGTTVKIGLVDENGCIIEKSVFPTPTNYESFIEEISKRIKKILKNNNLQVENLLGIGVGCPGVVDSNGIILSSCNLNLTNANLKEGLLKEFSTKIKVSNDANCAIMAEVKFGSAKGYRNAVMLTLGTGVGGGVVIDGKLFEGGNSTGAELGHFTLVANGEQCSCGRKGCVEQYVSTSSIIKNAKKEMLNEKDSSLWKAVSKNLDLLDGIMVFNEAKKGDKTALKVVDNFINYLADTIMSYNNVFRPEIFILGGGVSAQGDYIIEKVVNKCERFNYGYKGAPIPKITCATLYNDAGIVGAFSLIV